MNCIQKYKMNHVEKASLKQEIKRQLNLYAESCGCHYDAMVLLVLYRYYGFRKKRLRKFWEHYEELENDLHKYYQTVPVTLDVKGLYEEEFYALEELKRAGVDVARWRDEKDTWDPDKDDIWKKG